MSRKGESLRCGPVRGGSSTVVEMVGSMITEASFNNTDRYASVKRRSHALLPMSVALEKVLLSPSSGATALTSRSTNLARNAEITPRIFLGPLR